MTHTAQSRCLRSEAALIVAVLVSASAPAFANGARPILLDERHAFRVSAVLMPAPKLETPAERNLQTMQFAPGGACGTCFQADRQAAMEIRVSTQPLVQMLGPDLRGPKLRWSGSKAGFTEHNLRMRVSRNRGALTWESKF